MRRDSNKVTLYISLITLLLVCFRVGIPVKAQDDILQGPILATQSPFRGQITFQDVGTRQTWELEVPLDEYGYSKYRLDSWLSDGCSVLVGRLLSKDELQNRSSYILICSQT